MIARLHGIVEDVFEDSIIVDVNGIGFEVFANTKDLDIIKGNSIALYIYTHIFQDGIRLYGFKTRFEIKIFKDLIKVSKIGPKTAFNIINSTTTGDLIKSIKEGDVSYLTSIKGIGKKAAERIIVELSEKEFDMKGQDFVAKNEVTEALLNLGFDRNQIYEVLKNIKDKTSMEDILKQALKELGK
jgi:Holliday junction DNA helicase RuvA